MTTLSLDGQSLYAIDSANHADGIKVKNNEGIVLSMRPATREEVMAWFAGIIDGERDNTPAIFRPVRSNDKTDSDFVQWTEAEPEDVDIFGAMQFKPAVISLRW